MHIRAVWFALIASFVAACGSSAGDGASSGAEDPPVVPEAPDVMRRSDVCIKDACTACEIACDECLSTCFEAMVGSGEVIDCHSSCSYSCSGDCTSSCSGEVACLESLPGFALPQHADKEIEAACDRAVARDQSCGETNLANDCAHYARIERPEVVASYDCFSETPCGEPTDACHPAATLLGDELCDVLTSACAVECDPEHVVALNTNAGWLRDDVIEALRTCWSDSCTFVTDCVDAWWAQVFPS